MVIVRLLLGKIIGCGAGERQGKFKEIDDDPFPSSITSGE
jgi:hypothetical protein